MRLGLTPVPKENIFDTSVIESTDAHILRCFQTCTGNNWHIPNFVWNTPAAATIAKKVFSAYITFRNNCKQGEIFTAVLHCKIGNHRSVAMAVLLEIIFRVLLQFAGEHDVSVETVHRSEEIGHWT